MKRREKAQGRAPGHFTGRRESSRKWFLAVLQESAGLNCDNSTMHAALFPNQSCQINFILFFNSVHSLFHFWEKVHFFHFPGVFFYIPTFKSAKKEIKIQFA